MTSSPGRYRRVIYGDARVALSSNSSTTVSEYSADSMKRRLIKGRLSVHRYPVRFEFVSTSFDDEDNSISDPVSLFHWHLVAALFPPQTPKGRVKLCGRVEKKKKTKRKEKKNYAI